MSSRYIIVQLSLGMTGCRGTSGISTTMHPPLLSTVYLPARPSRARRPSTAGLIWDFGHNYRNWKDGDVESKIGGERNMWFSSGTNNTSQSMAHLCDSIFAIISAPGDDRSLSHSALTAKLKVTLRVHKRLVYE